MVIGVASNALTVVAAGAFQAGGTDICPMVPAPRIAAETSPGPRSAPSDSDLAMLVSGARNAGAMSAGGGAAAAAALPSSGKIPKFFSAPMMPVPIELMLLIEPIIAYQASRPSSKQNSSPTMLGKGIALTISPASRKKGVSSGAIGSSSIPISSRRFPSQLPSAAPALAVARLTSALCAGRPAGWCLAAGR
ncbi:Uncharacterised protein [Mycobacterium tuberculosis]|nr:Uncharacterised protein [Mycobacterium tuberculosis]